MASCSGSRSHSKTAGISKSAGWILLTTMLMLAGRTAAYSTMRAMPAADRVTGIRSPMPPNMTATPLIKTNSLCQGKYAGMIVMKVSVAQKCRVPSAIIRTANNIRNIGLSFDTMVIRDRFFVGGFLWLLISYLVLAGQHILLVKVPAPLSDGLHIKAIFSAALFIVGAIILSARYFP